ncbi:MAG: DUF2877 domain-containing protein [Dehalococcoidia bacterium]|nr:MAG: DUF2877 domain-containing protein [Dehalococcoidia bacterium]
MTMWTVARSISWPVKQRLGQGQFIGRVLAVFENACNLVTSDGEVMALVTPQIGNGPFNIVVDNTAGLFSEITPNTLVALEDERLWVGRLQVDLAQAVTWNPQPDWDTLRLRRDTIASYLPHLHALGCQYAPANVFLALLRESWSGDRLLKAIYATAHKAAKSLQAGWNSNSEQLREAALGLAGLGGGLTPAGDDFLMGAMLWAWLAHPTPDFFCQTLLQIAFSRTTTLSAAFLQAAAQGQCSISWHTLLTALSMGQKAKITASFQEILSHGATSGADTLAGFLYFPMSDLRRFRAYSSLGVQAGRSSSLELTCCF